MINPKLIACLPGDGVGPEVVAQAVRVLQAVAPAFDLPLRFEEGLVGATAYRAKGHPLPADTLDLVDRCDAILFGSVGDASLDGLPRPLRPEQSLSILRKRYQLFCNLRPTVIYPELADLSPLRPDRLQPAVDLVIVRELAGGIYYGQPRGIEGEGDGRRGFNTEVYSVPEVRRITHEAFRLARSRRRRLTSVDKANALESSELWRTVVSAVAAEYPDVAVEHMYVDNCAMQLVRRPGSFDVIVTDNLFGDILSDEASMISGSIGLGASASLGAGKVALYEAIHGTAPDIAGQDKANPLATILSAALLLRHSCQQPEAADLLQRAVARTIAAGYRTGDIARPGEPVIGTKAMGDAVLRQCQKLLKTKSVPARGV